MLFTCTAPSCPVTEPCSSSNCKLGSFAFRKQFGRVPLKHHPINKPQNSILYIENLREILYSFVLLFLCPSCRLSLASGVTLGSFQLSQQKSKSCKQQSSCAAAVLVQTLPTPPGAAAFCRECPQQQRDRGDCTSLPILKRQSHTQARGTGSSDQLHSSLSLRSVPARQALISTSTRKMQRKEQSIPSSLKNVLFFTCASEGTAQAPVNRCCTDIQLCTSGWYSTAPAPYLLHWMPLSINRQKCSCSCFFPHLLQSYFLLHIPFPPLHYSVH